MPEYIDRSAALFAVNEFYHDPKVDIVLEKIHAADVEPVRHGKWVMRGGKRFCSACLERACVTRDTEDFWYTKGTKYCPNCGAKMEEKQNAE